MKSVCSNVQIQVRVRSDSSDNEQDRSEAVDVESCLRSPVGQNGKSGDNSCGVSGGVTSKCCLGNRLKVLPATYIGTELGANDAVGVAQRIRAVEELSDQHNGK